MASVHPNSSFDGFNQNFTILLPDGKTPYTGNLADFNLLQTSQLNEGIIFGAQIGVTGLLLIIMLMMTKPDKRRSLVLVFNTSVLLTIFIRNIMAACLLGSPFYNFYSWEVSWYPQTKEVAYYIRLSVATESLGVIVTSLISASLMLQVHIICCTLSETRHRILMGFCGVLTGVVCSLRLALAITNSMWCIVGLRTTTLQQWDNVQKLASANNITTVTCIAIFSAIFNTKLVMAILLRRQLKITQFGPLQIIFVMGLQTMFVPLIIGIVAFFIAPGSQLQTFVDTFVAIFLPLSAMWASANTSNTVAHNAADRRAVPVGAFDASDHSSQPSSAHHLVRHAGTDYSSFSEKGILSPSSHDFASTQGSRQNSVAASSEHQHIDRLYQDQLG